MDVAYPRIAERLFGHAHAIEPTALRALLEGPAAQRILSAERPEIKAGKKQKSARQQRLSAIVGAEPVQVAGGVGEYGLTDAGVAIVPICGVLSRRFDWLTALCGWTTYEGLSATFDAMLADSRVKAIMMDVESGGGEAAGMLDIADQIIAARAEKPIWAVANTFAASAAYALGGCADRLVLPRLGQVGSIGAVIVHRDESRRDQANGYNYTAIYAGERKIDGWGHAPLSDDARAEFDADVEHCRQEFAELVGRQGRMSAKEALATQAAIYSDKAAVDARLADAVMTFDQALSELSEIAAGAPRNSATAAATAVKPNGDDPMSKTPSGANAPAAEKTAEQIAAEAAAAATAAAAAANATTAEVPADDKEKDKDKDAKGGKGKKSADDVENDEDEEKSGKKASAILELCTIAGASLADARGFITAGSSLADVRAQLAARAAKTADAQPLDGTRPATPAANAGWDDVVAKVNSQFGVSSKK